MINAYIKFWLISGAIVWPTLAIYNLLQPPSENNIFQIVCNNSTTIEKAAWLITTPLQGAVIGFILGSFIFGIILVELWNSIAKPILNKLGI